jgi:hypothetical protein
MNKEVNRIRGRYYNRDEEKQREILQCRGRRKHLCVYSLIRVEQSEVER